MATAGYHCEENKGGDSNNQEIKLRMKEFDALLETFKELNQSNNNLK